MLAISYARRYLSTSKTLSSRIKIANKIPKNYASSKKPEQYVDYNIPDSPRPLATKDLDLHKNAEIINRKKQEANMELESSSLFKKLVFAKEYKIHRVAGIVLFTVALWFHPDFGAYAVWFPIISGIAIFYEVYL